MKGVSWFSPYVGLVPGVQSPLQMILLRRFDHLEEESQPSQ